MKKLLLTPGRVVPAARPLLLLLALLVLVAPPLASAWIPSAQAAGVTELPGRPAGPGVGADIDLLHRIEQQAAEIRGITPQQPVPVNVVNQVDLAAYVKQRAAASAAETADAPDLSTGDDGWRLLALLGLVTADQRPNQLGEQVVTQRIGGMYFPELGAMLIVTPGNVDAFGPVEQTTFVHEFTHALQDQRFNLATFSSGAAAANLDRAQAIRSQLLKFGPDGRFLAVWGGRGRGAGQFRSVGPLAVDSQSAVYAADGDLRRVQKFAPTGELLATFTLPDGGEDDEEDDGDISGLGVGPDGSLYVLDGAQPAIVKFAPSGAVVATWGSRGAGPGQMKGPVDLAVDAVGDVYVLDAGNHRVQRFDAGGAVQTIIGRRGEAPGELGRALGLAVDRAGRVLVTESGALGRLQVRTFLDWGINTLRVWCQWDFAPPRNFIDTAPDRSLYGDDGTLREPRVATLLELCAATNALGMVLEVTLFSHEKRPQLPQDVLERGAQALAGRLAPYRHVIVQLWNEDSTAWEQLHRAVKETDPARLVTSSPGGSNVLGTDEHNSAMDLLTPHTIRRSADRPFWEVAPEQIRGLIQQSQKPVVDDEPARSGPTQFGGIEGGTRPEWHVAAIDGTRAAGGYSVYHHDMFQYGYDSPLTPPSGIPEPDWSSFHRVVFEHLRATKSW